MTSAKKVCADVVAVLLLIASTCSAFVIGSVIGFVYSAIYSLGKTAVMAIPLMLAWNFGLCEAAGLPPITFIQASCLNLCCRVLLKGSW